MLESFPPTNIDLFLPLGNRDVANLGQIKVLDSMMGMTKNFHPEGLYSTEIFGRVGSAARTLNFGFIDLHIPVFHPVYYKALCDLKELYGEIISGKGYAIFDHQTRDFVKSDLVNGETGFKFFLEHFEKLRFAERDSAKRKFNIALVEKHRNKPMMDKLLIMPAGLRDYTVDENGKPSEDEINTLYRSVLGTSNIVENISIATNEEQLNTIRYNLQMAVNKIYLYITNILEGKGKLIQGKWAARNIDNSTRNVITPYIQNVKHRDDPQFVSAEQAVVGLYQMLRVIFPVAVNRVRDGFLSKAFPGPNSPANLVDVKTKMGVSVAVDPSFYDDWMTQDGLENQFHRFKIKDLRHEPVMVGKYYLGLIYNGPDITGSGPNNGYRFLSSIADLPSNLNPEHVHAITYAELFYLSIFQAVKDIPVTITRYPITGMGSIYPSYVYLKSTITGLVKYELDDEWRRTGVVAPEYPKHDDYFFDALSPASQHLGRLGGDYDGDTCSCIGLYLDDSKEEIRKLFGSRDYYVSVDGSLNFSSNNDVLSLVLSNLA